MRAIIEHFIVAVIALFMAQIGWWLMGKYNGSGLRSFDFTELGWTLYVSCISVVTWMYLYRMCRRLHWLVLPVMGALSPVIGAVLFVIPFLWIPFVILWQFAPVIFPVGVFTGFLITCTTLPFRPRDVLRKNA